MQGELSHQRLRSNLDVIEPLAATFSPDISPVMMNEKNANGTEATAEATPSDSYSAADIRNALATPVTSSTKQNSDFT